MAQKCLDKPGRFTLKWVRVQSRTFNVQSTAASPHPPKLTWEIRVSLRRQFLVNLAGLAATAACMPSALAQESGAAQLPFRRVGPNASEKNTVLVFFQFSCSACRTYHPSLDRWGRSLPKDVHFQFVPIVYPEKEAIYTARAWLAAGLLGRPAQAAFETAAYSAVQSRSLNPVELATWTLVARDAGLSHSAYSVAWDSVRLNSVEKLAALYVRSGEHAAPSVLIDGQYVVTPDNRNGDETIFINLLDGIVSAMIEGRQL